ncbi:hypothetical protein DPV78_003844 [Talaromyces pinophilus]|nr:hypothetical protein DPV78_003844 [Talaromyces pinophilus]
MFGGEQQLSKEEIKAGEIEAQQTVQFAVVGGILLYLCTPPPHPFASREHSTRILQHANHLVVFTAPFAIDFAKKFL